MKRLQFVFLIVFFGLLSAFATAQTQPPDALGVDDLIEVSVLSHDGMDKELTVLSDGTIAYPYIGALKAVGKTASQLAADIKTALEKSYNNVLVTVTIKEVRSRKVRIVGPVKTPGAYDLKPGWRILDIVAMSGGLSARPATVTGRVIHADGKTEPFDMVAAALKPDTSANPILGPNDMVYLEQKDPAANKIYVMGQVNKPGSYDVGENGSNLVAILSEAGNPTDGAALTRVAVMRGTQVIPLNLEPIILHGQLPDDLRTFQLQAGDVLFVPEIDQRVAIMGQVNKPGNYPLPESKPITALEALSLAGGQTQNGDTAKAGVIRTVDGKATVIELNLDKMLRSKNMAANVTLKPGDVLYIPAKGPANSFDWRNIMGPLSILSFIGKL